MSRGRAVSAWYGKQVEVSNIMVQNPYTILLIKEGQHFDSMKA